MWCGKPLRPTLDHYPPRLQHRASPRPPEPDVRPSAQANPDPEGLAGEPASRARRPERATPTRPDMTDAERQALIQERDDLARKLKKREGEGGFKSNVAALKARIAEIDAALAGG